MYTLIRYPVGTIVEAVVLRKGLDRMRIVAPGFPDALELRRSGAQWVTETGQPVEFDFMFSGSPEGEVLPFSRPDLTALAPPDRRRFRPLPQAALSIRLDFAPEPDAVHATNRGVN